MNRRKANLPSGYCYAAIALLSCASSAHALSVNSPNDIDLASLPYITAQTPKNARNDGECTLAEAVELVFWTNSGGSQATKPTFDCGTANVGKNKISFTKNFTIVLKKRAFSQSAFEIASHVEIAGPVTIDADKKTRPFRLGYSGSLLYMHDKVNVINGSADGGGAAILVTSPAAFLIVDDCSFEGNQAVNGDGGAINSAAVEDYKLENGAEIQISGTNIWNSTFQKNTANRGGAYYGAPSDMVGDDFLQNSAVYAGGGLYITGGVNRMQGIHAVIARGNTVYHPYEGPNDPGGSGGFVFSNSSIFMTYSELSENAVNVDDVERVDPLIDMPRPYDATDMFGGALHLGTGAGEDSRFYYSTFFSNRAGQYNGGGGAMRLDRPALLVGISMQNNAAVVGGALYAKAPSTSETSAVSVINSSIIYNGLPGVFFGGGLPPSEYINVTGSVVTRGSTPLKFWNSFVYQNSGGGVGIIAEKGTPASIELRNTAVGAQQDTFNNVCYGAIYDFGGNIQTLDPLSSPPGVTCPASIPVAADSKSFILPKKIQTLYNIGRNREPLYSYVGLPDTGSIDQMKGKGVEDFCKGPPVDNWTQLEEQRSDCDIGPMDL